MNRKKALLALGFFALSTAIALIQFAVFPCSAWPLVSFMVALPLAMATTGLLLRRQLQLQHAGQELWISFGVGLVLFLTLGLVFAPKTAPRFHGIGYEDVC